MAWASLPPHVAEQWRQGGLLVLSAPVHLLQRPRLFQHSQGSEASLRVVQVLAKVLAWRQLVVRVAFLVVAAKAF